eukprot:6244769-Prymnesium_polylepis.1
MRDSVCHIADSPLAHQASTHAHLRVARVGNQAIKRSDNQAIKPPLTRTSWWRVSTASAKSAAPAIS